MITLGVLALNLLGAVASSEEQIATKIYPALSWLAVCKRLSITFFTIKPRTSLQVMIKIWMCKKLTLLQVDNEVTQMDQATQPNAALVEKMAAAAVRHQGQVQNMMQAVSVFKLDSAYSSQVKPQRVNGYGSNSPGAKRTTRAVSNPSSKASLVRLNHHPFLQTINFLWARVWKQRDGVSL